MNLNQLAQYEIEEEYDKQKIKRNLKNILNTHIQDKILDSLDLVNDYLDTEYEYASKNVRMTELKEVSMYDVICDVFVSVLWLQYTPIQAVASSILSYMPHELEAHKLKSACELVTVICGSDVYDIIHARDTEENRIMVKANFSFDEVTMQYISNTMYLPPMLCKPLKVKSNYSSGYLTRDEHIVLGNRMNQHDEYQALDVINMMNETELCLDTNMLKYEEVPNKPLDTIEKKEAFNRMKLSSRKVYRRILDEGNHFWFTWKYDFRGRMYSQGYHISMQGTDFKKSLISLKNKVVIPLD